MSSKARSIFLKNKPHRDFEISSHISMKNDYVFVQISKAASSSVKWALQSLEFKDTPWKLIDVNNKFYSPHLSPYQLKNEIVDDIFFSTKYKRFSFVRNPYTRLLSCYLHRIIGEPTSVSNKELKKLTGGRGGDQVSFAEFIEIISSQDSKSQEAHWRRQSDDLSIDEIKYDFIGKLENIDNDLSKMLEMIYSAENMIWLDGIKKVDASPMKTGSSEKVKQYYKDEKIVRLIQDSFGKDFEVFGYSESIIDV